MTFPLQAIAQHHELTLVAGVAIGFGFGFVLERAGFGNARRLVAQFYGTRMVMLKVMFTAIVTTVLATAIAAGLGLLDLRALADSATTPVFLWPMIAGGFLIGVGIILSGYCPGTSVVGMASGKLDAAVAFAGVMVGQLAWAELEFRGPFARFHDSGSLGHYYLYDLFHVPPAVVAAAVVLVALGAFLAAEKIERMLAGTAEGAARPRRYVFAGLGAFGAVALATLALPTGTDARSAPSAGRIAPADLARRVLDEPWKVRVLDLRPMDACAKERVPGAECAPPAALKELYLGDVWPARDLVVVGEGDLAEVPADVGVYRGKVLVLERGFEGWREWALTPPPPPAPGASAAERDEYRLRAGIQAALTGVKAPPPPPMPVAGGSPAKRKAGGGGCSG